MRKLILAVAALGVLGGGGAGAYFFLMKKPAEAALPADAKVAEVKKEEHGKEGEHAEPKFVKLDPLVVPIVDSEGVSQVISMVIQFEVKDEESAKKVESLRPRIKDAFITDMYGLMNSKAAMDNGVLRVGYVKKRLTDISQRVMGDGVIDSVLLQMVQQNPI